MLDRRPSDAASPERLRGHLLRIGLESHGLRQAVARALSMTPTEASALALVSLGRPRTSSEVGRPLGLSSAGATTLIVRLEARDYISRSPHPTDARSRLLSPTPTAVTAFERLYAPLVADLDKLSSALSNDKRTVLTEFLGAACQHVARAADDLTGGAGGSCEDPCVNPVPCVWG